MGIVRYMMRYVTRYVMQRNVFLKYLENYLINFPEYFSIFCEFSNTYDIKGKISSYSIQSENWHT